MKDAKGHGSEARGGGQLHFAMRNVPAFARRAVAVRHFPRTISTR